MIIKSMKDREKREIKREKREERREEREMRREAREVARYNDYQANLVAKAIEKKLELQDQVRKLKMQIEKKEESNEQYFERKKQEIENQKNIAKGRFAPVYERYNMDINTGKRINRINENLLPEGMQTTSCNVEGYLSEMADTAKKIQEKYFSQMKILSIENPQERQKAFKEQVAFIKEQGAVEDPLIKKYDELVEKIQYAQNSLQKDPTSGNDQQTCHRKRNWHKGGTGYHQNKKWKNYNNNHRRRGNNHYNQKNG